LEGFVAAHNEEFAREDEVEIPVQVNGKVRSRLKIATGAKQDTVVQMALRMLPSLHI